MNNAKIIGIGAAGNKAAIMAIEAGFPKDNVMLLNSTLKDIPLNYKDIAIELSGAHKGCGKERDLGKQITFESIKNETLPLDSFCDPNDKMVIIVNSSEGGTGCGGSSVLAKYIKGVLKQKVHMFVFVGFEEDPRGLKNTVDYFKEINEEYTVQAISNKKFLKEANGNKLRAETLANEEFVRRIEILLGKDIIESETNIDETDLTKLTTEPGFMTIEYGQLDKIKNIESFNKTVSDIIDNSKSLDIEPTAKRIGVILNISEKTKHNIDYFFNTIKHKFGVPFENYTHVQSVQEPEYIAIISSGMKMPVEDIVTISNKFKETFNKVNSAKDEFFNMDLDTGLDTSEFDMKKQEDPDLAQLDKKNFFNDFSPINKSTTFKELESMKTKFKGIIKKEDKEEEREESNVKNY